jgi:hypothetical protein
MLPARFETASPTSYRLQTHALDLAATGIGLEINSTEKVVRVTKLRRMNYTGETSNVYKRHEKTHARVLMIKPEIK